MTRVWLIAVLLLAAALSVGAAPVNTITEATESEPVRSDIVASDVRVNSAWELTELEATRVATLLKGIRGAVSNPRISPLEVLGIHARSEAERLRYAERWARLQIADAERVLAFERAYRRAVRDLLEKRAMIDRALLSPRARNASLAAGDRLLFFTRANCAACEALQARVLNQAGQLAGVDLFLVDETRPDAIRAWAREQGIDPARVRAKQVTLNADNGLLKRLTERSVEPPYLLRQRGATLQPIVLLDRQ